ncbi:hypothetical protein [Altericroceibacterium endophyticum]|uniref:Uncharacterized protein n=1 Tax=Altericroceibacterium endophyticum TaxID=1808508 RepID=A0A6I4T4D4_9SPHN|nr:hypothetical protein [Altericroceibacterium endophyticum]MXO64800.1 hypothetical protein [Altericroceibacterium endophyticum]
MASDPSLHGICYETVWSWWNWFGQMFAADARPQRANLQTALADALIADLIAAVRKGTNELRIGATITSFQTASGWRRRLRVVSSSIVTDCNRRYEGPIVNNADGAG